MNSLIQTNTESVTLPNDSTINKNNQKIKKDERCKSFVSCLSGTKYCDKHYKENQVKKEEEKTCCYKNKKGINKDNVCGKKISTISISGCYCTKHLKEEKNGENTFDVKQKISKPKRIYKNDESIIEFLKSNNIPMFYG